VQQALTKSGFVGDDNHRLILDDRVKHGIGNKSSAEVKSGRAFYLDSDTIPCGCGRMWVLARDSGSAN